MQLFFINTARLKTSLEGIIPWQVLDGLDLFQHLYILQIIFVWTTRSAALGWMLKKLLSFPFSIQVPIRPNPAQLLRSNKTRHIQNGTVIDCFFSYNIFLPTKHNFILKTFLMDNHYQMYGDSPVYKECSSSLIQYFF